MKETIIKIETPGNHFEFVAIIHIANKEDELQLDMESFYIPFRPEGEQLSFPHHEIEIINDFSNLEHVSKLHIHSTRNNKKFVCWTADVKTLEQAETILKLWAVGTVYTLITGEDFAAKSYEAKTPELFNEKMKEEYKIVIV